MNIGQINLEIAKLQFGDLPMRIMANHRVAITIREGDKPRKVDYCHDWNDAGWLIQKEGISITYHSKFNMWEASKGDVEAVSQSATAAVALCYLKMNGIDV
jgi:hypothetical protein